MIRILFIFFAFFTLILGIIGIFIPLLPTTPFLLLSSFLFMKSSPRLQEWLLRNKYLGPYIVNFQKNKAISLQTKIFTISLLWTSILISAFVFVENVWIRILLFVIAVAVSTHILSFKTLKK